MLDKTKLLKKEILSLLLGYLRGYLGDRVKLPRCMGNEENTGFTLPLRTVKTRPIVILPYTSYRICLFSAGKVVCANKHNSFVTCVVYHPFDANVYLSGTSNDGIFAWDIRTQQVSLLKYLTVVKDVYHYNPGVVILVNAVKIRDDLRLNFLMTSFQLLDWLLTVHQQ